MSSPPYLTEEEIAHITKPRTQGAARVRYFREKLKCKVEPRPNGQPLVWRADFEAARMAAPAANDSRQASKDWTAFDQRVRYGRGTKAKRRQPTGARAAR